MNPNSLGDASLLKGVLDVHVHCDPDSIPRPIDGIDLARMAKTLGMRGFVMKNHYEPTASLAYLARKEVPGVEVFGSIVLNTTVGGINPEAVERMAMINGGWGRVVWMPSCHSESHVRYWKQDRPFVSISRNSELLPEVKQVIEVIARRNLVLATGHSSAEENLMLVREARKQGVRRTIVTHAMMIPAHMNIAEMREAAELGAYIEFVYNGLIGPHKEFHVSEYKEAIRSIGIRSCILSSDMGQTVNPVHPEGLLAFFNELRTEGFTNAEIEQMARFNSEDVLGLSDTHK
jgi:hypothetical protein